MKNVWYFIWFHNDFKETNEYVNLKINRRRRAVELLKIHLLYCLTQGLFYQCIHCGKLTVSPNSSYFLSKRATSVIVHVLELSSELIHTVLFISVWQLVEHFISCLFDAIDVVMVVVTAKSLRQDHVGLQHCLSLCMDGTEGGIFQQTNEVRLRSFLKS